MSFGCPWARVAVCWYSEYQTRLPGVFAVGDILCNHVMQAVAAAAVDKYIYGRKPMALDWVK